MDLLLDRILSGSARVVVALKQTAALVLKHLVACEVPVQLNRCGGHQGRVDGGECASVCGAFLRTSL